MRTPSDGRVDAKVLMRQKAVEAARNAADRKLGAQRQARQEKVAAALKERFDRLNAAWTEKEASLSSLQVPREVYLCYEELLDDGCPSPDHPRRKFYLGLVKHKGKWRICHGVSELADDHDQVDWKPVVECSFEYRVSLVQHFEKLQDEVIAAAEEAITEVEDSISALQAT